jgi:hypothetical protein
LGQRLVVLVLRGLGLLDVDSLCLAVASLWSLG